MGPVRLSETENRHKTIQKSHAEVENSSYTKFAVETVQNVGVRPLSETAGGPNVRPPHDRG